MVFSFDIQVLVRQVIRSRDVALASRNKTTATDKDSSSERLDVEQAHDEQLQKLIKALRVHIAGEEADVQDVAVKIVKDLFGLAIAEAR